jgi:hypothetical protein
VTARAASAFRRPWTADEIRGLGTRTDVPTAGSILAGLSPTQSYELAKRGGFPVPVLAVGRRLVVPVAPILEALGLGLGGVEHRSQPADQDRREPGEHWSQPGDASGRHLAPVPPAAAITRCQQGSADDADGA